MTEAAQEKPTFDFNSAHRAAYANILEAKPFKKNGVAAGEPRYDASFLVSPDNEDLKRLQGEVVKMLKAKNPGKQIVARRLTQEEVDKGNVIEVHVPWSAGDKEANRIVSKAKPGDEAKAEAKAAIFRGQIIVKASSKYQPQLSALENRQVLEFTTDESKAANGKKYFYPGAFLVPSFKLHAYPGETNKPGGVALYLDGVLFVKHGEKLAGGGGRNPAEVFKGYLGSIKDEDPTGGAKAADELDDEIPF